jgi:hypothetical protein
LFEAEPVRPKPCIRSCPYFRILVSTGLEFQRQEAAYTMSESKVIANQKTIVKNQKTIISNQSALRANQTAIKKNQATILKNQSAILKNQGALETIIENQKEILARLNK